MKMFKYTFKFFFALMLVHNFGCKEKSSLVSGKPTSYTLSGGSIYNEIKIDSETDCFISKAYLSIGDELLEFNKPMPMNNIINSSDNPVLSIEMSLDWKVSSNSMKIFSNQYIESSSGTIYQDTKSDTYKWSVPTVDEDKKTRRRNMNSLTTLGLQNTISYYLDKEGAIPAFLIVHFEFKDAFGSGKIKGSYKIRFN